MPTTLRDEKPEVYLTKCAVAWTVVSSIIHANLESEWNAIYGDVWRLQLKHLRQARAQHEYLRYSADTFFIVPFLGNHAGPTGVGTREPRTAAYECHTTGAPPDLSDFSSLDFFAAPPDLTWTMLYTHEDGGLGRGPYFIRTEWLVPPTRARGSTV